MKKIAYVLVLTLFLVDLAMGQGISFTPAVPVSDGTFTFPGSNFTSRIRVTYIPQQNFGFGEPVEYPVLNQSNSVWLGTFALWNSTNVPAIPCSSNVGIGFGAGGSTFGSFNTSVGIMSGYQARTATHNVAIGLYAGHRVNGSSNVFIGSGAASPYRTNSNVIAIGGGHTGELANSTAYLGNEKITNTLVYGALRIVGFPTNAAGLPVGTVWSDGGTLKIVQ